MLKSLKMLALMAALAVGSATAAQANDCCKPGADCCKPGSPCCKK